jgi:hypothetical protein
MELRRWLKDLRVLRARRRGEDVVLEFETGTRVDAARLVELVRGSKGRWRLLSGSALAVRPEATDHDGLIGELRALLQRLSAA